VNFLDPDLFFQFLKGRCYSNRFWAKFAKWPLFNTLAFRNGFDYRNFNSKIFNGNIFSTYCANLIKIGPVIPEITRAKSTPFWPKRQKSAFRTKYLSMYGIDCNHNFSASRQMYANYKTEINFVIIKGTLLWYWLTLTPLCRCQNWPSSLFALAFRNKMQHRFVSAWFNSYTNASTSCEIWWRSVQ